MKKNTVLGIVAAIAFCAVVALAFYFLAHKNKPGHGKTQAGQASHAPQRKLAFSGDPDRNIEKAQEAEGKGDWASALYYYRYLSESLPDKDLRKGWATYKEALCLYNQGSFEAAKTDSEYALNHFPDMPSVDNALFLMAQIYTKLGDFDEADKTYNTIIRMFAFRADEAKNLKAQLPQNQTNKGQNQGPQPRTVPAKP
jgi:tetratricopeptide (TPR) repeat protein